MRHSLRTRLALSTALVLVTAPLASADVTVADVWQNLNAPIRAMGMTVSATETISGSATTYSDITYEFSLPLGVGGGSLQMSQLILTDNGDGTVSLDYGDELAMAISGFVTGEGSFSADFAMTGLATATTVATGTPGNVTYTANAGETSYGISLGNIMIDNQLVDGFALDGVITASSASTTQQIIEGDLVQMVLQSNAGAGTTNLSLTDPTTGNTTQINGTQSDNSFSIALSLPSGGSDLLNLAPALAQGMSFAASLQAGATDQLQTVTSDLGVQVSSQTTRYGANELTMAFDQAGFIATGTSDSLEIEVQDQFIPFPIAVSAGATEARYEFPVTASDEAQPFALVLNLADLAFSDDLWNLVDASQQLDRAPADMRINLSGDTFINSDLMNFEALTTSIDSGSIPVTITQLDIDEIQFGALGAVFQAAGALSMNSDEYFFGTDLPTMVGSLNFSLDGLNQAMQQLVGAGLLSPDDLFGANLMVGMVAVPSGDDSLSSEIVFGEDGSISANGQRLR